MEIKQNLSMPASDFYQKIMTSVLFDIKQQTGEKLPKRNLLIIRIKNRLVIVVKQC